MSLGPFCGPAIARKAPLFARWRGDTVVHPHGRHLGGQLGSYPFVAGLDCLTWGLTVLAANAKRVYSVNIARPE